MKIFLFILIVIVIVGVFYTENLKCDIYQETKDEEGDEVNKILVKNKKGEKFYVIFFNDEIDVIAIEKKNELVFYTN